MHLRNKKTGEIVDVYNIYISKRVEDDSLTSHENVIRSFDSIAELNDEWEDYKPTEPLIKNEKIRKAVRAWAEANNINSGYYYDNDMKFNSSERKLTWIDTTIQFNELGALEGLEDGKRYTIAELCGEEEKNERVEV